MKPTLAQAVEHIRAAKDTNAAKAEFHRTKALLWELNPAAKDNPVIQADLMREEAGALEALRVAAVQTVILDHLEEAIDLLRELANGVDNGSAATANPNCGECFPGGAQNIPGFKCPLHDALDFLSRIPTDL